MIVLLRAIVLAFLLLFFCGALFLYGPAVERYVSLHWAQYTDATYAFYLSSGHVFYGNVRAVGPQAITLSHVYTFQGVSVGGSTTNNLVAQAASPLTMPEDWLVLERNKILFYERITSAARILSLMRGE